LDPAWRDRLARGRSAARGAGDANEGKRHCVTASRRIVRLRDDFFSNCGDCAGLASIVARDPAAAPPPMAFSFLLAISPLGGDRAQGAL
jgi:hypothetical protein